MPMAIEKAKPWATESNEMLFQSNRSRNIILCYTSMESCVSSYDVTVDSPNNGHFGT